MTADDDSVRVPLYCPLVINAEEGKAANGQQFRGYKQSGMGRELGYHGLNDFLELKQIFTDGTGLTMKPPYGQLIRQPRADR